MSAEDGDGDGDATFEGLGDLNVMERIAQGRRETDGMIDAAATTAAVPDSVLSIGHSASRSEQPETDDPFAELPIAAAAPPAAATAIRSSIPHSPVKPIANAAPALPPPASPFKTTAAAVTAFASPHRAAATSLPLASPARSAAAAAAVAASPVRGFIVPPKPASPLPPVSDVAIVAAASSAAVSDLNSTSTPAATAVAASEDVKSDSAAPQSKSTSSAAAAVSPAKPAKVRAIYDEDDDSDGESAKKSKSKSKSNSNTAVDDKSKRRRTDEDDDDDAGGDDDDVSNAMDVDTHARRRQLVDTEAGVEGEDPNAEEEDEELAYAAAVREQAVKVKNDERKQAKELYAKFIAPLVSKKDLTGDEAAKLAIIAHAKSGRAKVVEITLDTPTTSAQQKAVRRTQLEGLKRMKRDQRERRLREETGLNADGSMVEDMDGAVTSKPASAEERKIGEAIRKSAATQMGRLLDEISQRRNLIKAPSVVDIDRGDVVLRKGGKRESAVSAKSKSNSTPKAGAAAGPTIVTASDWVHHQRRTASGVDPSKLEWVKAPKLNAFDIIQISEENKMTVLSTGGDDDTDLATGVSEAAAAEVQKMVEGQAMADVARPSLYADPQTNTPAAGSAAATVAKPQYGPARPPKPAAAAPAAASAFELQLSATQTASDAAFDNLPMPVVPVVPATAAVTATTAPTAPATAASAQSTAEGAPAPAATAPASAVVVVPADSQRTETQSADEPKSAAAMSDKPTTAGSSSSTVSPAKPKLSRLRSVAEVEAEARAEAERKAKAQAEKMREILAQHNPNEMGVEIIPNSPEKPQRKKSSSVAAADDEALTQPTKSIVADDEAGEEGDGDGDEGEAEGEAEGEGEADGEGEGEAAADSEEDDTPEFRAFQAALKTKEEELEQIKAEEALRKKRRELAEKLKFERTTTGTEMTLPYQRLNGGVGRDLAAEKALLEEEERKLRKRKGLSEYLDIDAERSDDDYDPDEPEMEDEVELKALQEDLLAPKEERESRKQERARLRAMAAEQEGADDFIIDELKKGLIDRRRTELPDFARIRGASTDELSAYGGIEEDDGQGGTKAERAARRRERKRRRKEQLNENTFAPGILKATSDLHVPKAKLAATRWERQLIGIMERERAATEAKLLAYDAVHEREQPIAPAKTNSAPVSAPKPAATGTSTPASSSSAAAAAAPGATAASTNSAAASTAVAASPARAKSAAAATSRVRESPNRKAVDAALEKRKRERADMLLAQSEQKKAAAIAEQQILNSRDGFASPLTSSSSGSASKSTPDPPSVSKTPTNFAPIFGRAPSVRAPAPAASSSAAAAAAGGFVPPPKLSRSQSLAAFPTIPSYAGGVLPSPSSSSGSFSPFPGSSPSPSPTSGGSATPSPHGSIDLIHSDASSLAILKKITKTNTSAGVFAVRAATSLLVRTQTMEASHSRSAAPSPLASSSSTSSSSSSAAAATAVNFGAFNQEIARGAPQMPMIKRQTSSFLGARPIASTNSRPSPVAMSDAPSTPSKKSASTNGAAAAGAATDKENKHPTVTPPKSKGKPKAAAAAKKGAAAAAVAGGAARPPQRIMSTHTAPAGGGSSAGLMAAPKKTVTKSFVFKKSSVSGSMNSRDGFENSMDVSRSAFSSRTGSTLQQSNSKSGFGAAAAAASSGSTDFGSFAASLPKSKSAAAAPPALNRASSSLATALAAGGVHRPRSAKVK